MASWAMPTSAAFTATCRADRFPRVDPPGMSEWLAKVWREMPAPPCQQCHDGGGGGVGGVLLAAAVLEHHTAAQPGAVDRVALVRAVGVQGVDVVRRQQEALGQPGQIRALRQAQALRHPQQGVPQEGRGRTLPGGGADLLIVKDHMDRNGGALPALQEALEGGKGALEVIQPGAGEEYAAVAQTLGACRL